MISEQHDDSHAILREAVIRRRSAVHVTRRCAIEDDELPALRRAQLAPWLASIAENIRPTFTALQCSGRAFNASIQSDLATDVKRSVDDFANWLGRLVWTVGLAWNDSSPAVYRVALASEWWADTSMNRLVLPEPNTARNSSICHESYWERHEHFRKDHGRDFRHQAPVQHPPDAAPAARQFGFPQGASPRRCDSS